MFEKLFCFLFYAKLYIFRNKTNQLILDNQNSWA